MLHKKTKVDDSLKRRGGALTRCGVALLSVTFIMAAAAPHALAQKAAMRKTKTRSVNATPQVSKEDAKKLAEAASQSRANLLSASNAYRESLEKLLELQRQDESRAAEIVGKRKELLALGVIAKRELEEGEREIGRAQGKIAETTKRVAEVDQLVAEVAAAEELAKTSAESTGLYPVGATGLVVRYAGAAR